MGNAVNNYIVSSGLAFVTTLVLIFVFRSTAQKVGLVDRPGGRKRHLGVIPLVGGPAMFGGVAFAALMTMETLFHFRALFAGLGVLLVAGILDDLRDISPRGKFVSQIIAALFMAVWGGVAVVNLGDLVGAGVLHLAWWSIPFTVICVLGLINAMNMADGVDGLAGGLGIVATFFLGVAAYMSGQQLLLQFIAIILSSVLAFWTMNMSFPWQPHAKVFMGDSGSMMLGFILTWVSVDLVGSSSSVPAILPVWFLAIPLLDMGLVIVRRAVKRRSPFVAGRDHLHHILLVAGYRPSQIVYLLMSMAIGLGIVAVALWSANAPDWILFYTFLGLLVLGYLVSRRAWRVARFLRRLNLK